MDERYRFVSLAIQPDANLSELCRQFNISRKTGHELLRRYRIGGRAGIEERSRRPHSTPNSVSSDMVCEIVNVREGHPRWGGETIRTILLRRFAAADVPCARTIDRVLDRCGMVEHRRRRRGGRVYYPEQVVRPKQPNDVWTVDFKGWWFTKDGKRCMPLTIRDEYSRYILDIAALTHGSLEQVWPRFESCFERYGMPMFIRSDNGSPFCASQAIHGLSELAVRWIKLGILPNRIPPASPCYNGAHERMHKDMKAEIQVHPARNARSQQCICDEWRQEFNQIRPHRALQMKTPSEVYVTSPRSFAEAACPFVYDGSLETRRITKRGEFWWKGQRRFLAGALASETIGLDRSDSSIELWFCNFFVATMDNDGHLFLGK